jgi:spermidine synthase
MWKSDPVTLFLPYSQMMVAALALTSEPKRGLILGHGGGSLAKWLAQYWPELELDIVEVDPAVVRMANEYFGYQPPGNHHVYVKDARAFLNATAAKYDVIWADAFARHLIPFHLTTVEFFSELHTRLTPNGVVAVNIASSGEGGDLLRATAVVETLKTSFPVLETYAVKGPWRTRHKGAENIIFLGGGPVERTTQDEFISRVEALVQARRLPPESLSLLASHRSEPWSSGLMLTDDFAPYDLLVGSATPDTIPETGPARR